MQGRDVLWGLGIRRNPITCDWVTTKISKLGNKIRPQVRTLHITILMSKEEETSHPGILTAGGAMYCGRWPPRHHFQSGAVLLWPWIGFRPWRTLLNPCPILRSTTMSHTHTACGHYSTPSWVILSNFLTRDDKNKTLNKSRPLKSISKLKASWFFFKSWKPMQYNFRQRQ